MSIFSYLQNIYWREPLWFLLALQPLIIFSIKKLFIKNSLATYADKHLQPWVVFPNNFTFKNVILNKNSAYILAWLLLAISLAGPRTPLSQVDKEQFFGANIMLVVDLSRSMKATDILPNRLLRAKIEIHELLEKARDHRIGITVFTARPHLFVPLTSDHNVLKTYLKSLDDLTFPTRGSDPVAAIELAQQELVKSKGKSTILLVTDGDFPKLTKSQLKKLQQPNIPIYVLGIGTVEGEAIQKNDGMWLKHDDQNVVSRMNEEGLQQLSSYLKGKYSSVYDDDTDWITLYDKGIASHNTISNIDSNHRIVWSELFPYSLFPSILLFLISLSKYRINILKRISPVLALFISLNLLPGREAQAFDFNIALGQTIEQEAYRAHINKNYIKANKTYEYISGYLGYMGQGNSLYRMGHYQKAIPQFVSATLKAQTNTQRAKALYNLANSYFRAGSFSLAISSYEDVLRYHPRNKACLYNIKISKILKKDIEQRLKVRVQTISSPRQGRGPRSTSVAEGTGIGENTSVSMGGSENKLNDDIPLPDLPNMSEPQIAKLLLKGLNKVKFAEQGQLPNNQLSEESIVNIDLLNAHQQIQIMSDSQHVLWKRLFEIEEGFPAPVDKPKVIYGVKPW